MQLLSTKLSIPPLRSRLVPRPRLIQKLNQGLECGFILVSAPAGYGKTTQVSAWLSHVGIASAWLSLDERDNDPARYLAYITTALSGMEPSIDDAFVKNLVFEPGTDVETILTPLINRLHQVEQPFCLVLDDYHLIHDQAVHQVTSFLLEHRPAPFHLVIATRADPPLPLAKLRARSAVLELRQADLCFTLQEAADFLDHTMGLQISPEDIARITNRTEGWIAGLQMAALSMQNTDDISGFISALTGNHHYVFDYLLEEILGRQTPEIRRFLLSTSILDQFTPALCDALLGDEAGSTPSQPSAVILDELEHANLFIVPLDYQRNWYRYHHLFSDLLRLMLEQAHPGLSATLHQRACRWFEAQNMLPEALQHAISSGNMQLVAQIISSNVLVLVESNEIVPTQEKMDLLSKDDLVALPWLGIARAWALGAGQLQHSLQVLDAVEKSLVSAPDTPEQQRLKGHIAAARAYILGALGDRSEAIALARKADALLPADEIAVRALNLTILGDMLVAEEYGSNSMPVLEKALALALQADKPHIAMLATASIATAHLFAGRLGELHRVCLQALTISEDYQKRYQHSLSATAEVYALLARVLAEWGENEKAIQYAQKGVALGESWGRITSEELCLGYLARALIFSNDREQARQVILRADNLAQKVSPYYWQRTALFALDSLLDCDPPDPSEIDQQVRRLKESGAIFPDILTARLLVRDHRPDEALLVLEKILKKINGQSSFDTVRVYALRSLAFHAKGDGEQALNALGQALELAEPEKRIASFVREGAAMEKLLRQAQARAIAPRFVKQMLAAFEARRLHEPSTSSTHDALVEQLSQRELEVLKLLAHGCPDKKIAETLVIAPETVHKHLKNIYGKLDVHSRTEAIARARQLGMI